VPSVALVAIVFSGWLSPSAQATSFTFTVTKTADSNDGVCNSDCSIREALAASEEALLAACPGDPCDATSTLLIPARLDAYRPTLGVLSVEALTPGKTVIKGAGPGRTIVDGEDRNRDFEVGFGSVVEISGMTIRRGRFGGTDLPGSFCSVPHTHGGGIHNHGMLLLVNVTLTGNSAPDGGALASGTCPSTFDGDSPCPGGHGACATLINVTITDNRATGDPSASTPEGRGGGIFNGQALTLVNVTIADNAAADGSDIYAAAPPDTCGDNGDEPCPPRPMTVLNTIIAGPASGAVCGGIPLSSLGYNLFSDLSCSAIATDLVGADPRLGSLRGDGTLPLRRSSPAIDHGANLGCPTTDERGTARPQDGNRDGVAVCDIGAYERRSHSDHSDINGDGHADGVVGEPGRDNFAGGVHVLYGTDNALTADASGTALNDQLLTQNSPGVPGGSEANDIFGFAVAVADFNGDGCGDVAIGVPGEDQSAGTVIVLYGSTSGVITAGAQRFQEGTGVPGNRFSGEDFGDTLTTGDLNDDGIADLAIGVPFERAGGIDRGAVAVVYGAAGGLGTGTTATSLLTQNSPGVPGGSEDFDNFGFSLAVGDFDGAGVDDLAVGVPGENNATGVVIVLPGQATSGVGALAGTSFSQNTAGVPGTAEANDFFGGAVAAGDVTNDGKSDLAVGSPAENNGRGFVNLLKGSPTGLTGTGAQGFSQDSTGVVGVAGPDDGFGSALAMGHLDGGSTSDLAIGVPGDAIGSVPGAGSVNILLGTSAGLSTAEGGGERFSQDTDGIGSTAEDGDGFGFSLAALPIESVGIDNLLIGAPFEAIGSQTGAGIFHVLRTNEFGPVSFGSQTWSDNSAGVQGFSQTDGLFGFSID
jgi:CSLREA domain-containing protein